MKETSILKYDEDYDDDRSFFHKYVKETSIIKYDEDYDADRSFFHRYVKGTSVIKYDDDDDRVPCRRRCSRGRTAARPWRDLSAYSPRRRARSGNTRG